MPADLRANATSEQGTAEPAAAPVSFVDRLKASGKAGLKECEDCPVIVAIPGGAFQMGSNDEDAEEKPAHPVKVPGFAIGKFEVTFAQWDACVADGFCQAIPDRGPNGEDADHGWGRGDRPVIKVPWNDIKGSAGDGKQGFLAWVNAKVEGAPCRLPSEAEWEYAARAGSSARWSFGDRESALGDHAWFRGNSGMKTHPVGGKRANAFGLHDVHGNVWEWVEDCWNANYVGAPSDGSAWKTGDCKVAAVRGDSWSSLAKGLRVTHRIKVNRGFRSSFLGFRVARALVD